MLVGRAGAGSCSCQKTLRQYYFCAPCRSVGTVAAFSNAIERVAGSDDPGIGGGALQVLAEIFEDGRMFGRKRSKIVDGFVDTSRQAGGCDVVAEDSSIDHLREKGGLRDEFAHEVRNVFLAFRGEGFLVARATAEGDDDHFSLAGRDPRSSEQARVQKGTAQCESSAGTQKFAAGPSELARDFLRAGCFPGGQARPAHCVSR